MKCCRSFAFCCLIVSWLFDKEYLVCLVANEQFGCYSAHIELNVHQQSLELAECKCHLLDCVRQERLSHLWCSTDRDSCFPIIDSKCLSRYWYLWQCCSPKWMPLFDLAMGWGSWAGLDTMLAKAACCHPWSQRIEMHPLAFGGIAEKHWDEQFMVGIAAPEQTQSQ